MILQLERVAGNVRHGEERTVFQQHCLRADMPDIGEVFGRTAFGVPAITQHRSYPVHGSAAG